MRVTFPIRKCVYLTKLYLIKPIQYFLLKAPLHKNPAGSWRTLYVFLRRSPNFSVSVAHDNLRWVESFFQDFTFLTETNQCPTSPETCSAIMLYRAETWGLFPLKKGEERGREGCILHVSHLRILFTITFIVSSILHGVCIVLIQKA